MKRTIAAVALAGFIAPGMAMANSTGCGLGNQVFDGKSGIAPQVLAVTTNGTSGNQTFGISTGTLGCNPNDTVTAMSDVSVFADANLDRLAADVAAGEGETLATVGDLLGIAANDREHFNSVMQANFARLFPTTSTSSGEVVASMEAVMTADQRLSGYLS